MHKVNEAGIIISPRAHENDAALSAAMSSLPKDSPVLAALTEFQNAASSALPASTNGEFNVVVCLTFASPLGVVIVFTQLSIATQYYVSL